MIKNFYNNYSFFSVLSITGGPKTYQGRRRPVEYFPFSDAEHGIYSILNTMFPTLEDVRLYFKTIYRYDILTKSGGSLINTGEINGVTRVMYRKSLGIVYLDFNTSDTLWEKLDMHSFQEYYAENVKKAIKESLSRIDKCKGEILDKPGFWDKCVEGINIFLNTHYDLTPYS